MAADIKRQRTVLWRFSTKRRGHGVPCPLRLVEKRQRTVLWRFISAAISKEGLF